MKKLRLDRILRVGTAALLFLLSGDAGNHPLYAQAASAAPVRYEVLFEDDVAAKMRDGVTLRADIYRPRADGKFPVLLQRTPYDKANASDFARKAAARGYVVVVQDTSAWLASKQRLLVKEHGFWFRASYFFRRCFDEEAKPPKDESETPSLPLFSKTEIRP